MTGPDAEPMFATVQGHCPHGCGPTLELNIVTGQLSCSDDHCPDPNAVQAILDHNEPNHIIRITPGSWTVKHPLLERVEDKLFDCPVGKAFALFTGPPEWAKPGNYEVTVNDDGSWNWKRLEADGVTEQKHYFDPDWEAYRRGVDDGSIVFDADTMDRPYYRHLVPCAVCGKPDALSDEHYGPIEIPELPAYPEEMRP